MFTARPFLKDLLHVIDFIDRFNLVFNCLVFESSELSYSCWVFYSASFLFLSVSIEDKLFSEVSSFWVLSLNSFTHIFARIDLSCEDSLQLSSVYVVVFNQPFYPLEY